MTKRILLAIRFSLETEIQIINLQRQLLRHNLPVEWIDPGGLHLTLNFLGKMPHQDINEVHKKVSDIVCNFQPFVLQPQYLETLYKKHGDSIIYLSLGGQIDILSKLQKQLSKVLNEIAAQPIRYLPHISIGRVQKMDPDSTKKALNKVTDLDMRLEIDQFTVDGITLFESLLHGASATYQKIRDYKFAISGLL